MAQDAVQGAQIVGGDAELPAQGAQERPSRWAKASPGRRSRERMPSVCPSEDSTGTRARPSSMRTPEPGGSSTPSRGSPGSIPPRDHT